MRMRTGKMFTWNVAVFRADRKSRADREIWQVEILGNPPHHKSGALPVIQPLTEKTVENGAAGVKGLQRVLMRQSLENIIGGPDRELGRIGVVRL